MRYWLDTEFIENGTTIDLISIGIVCEDGRELYLANRECNFDQASQWVKNNVLIPMGFDYSKPNIPMRPIDPDFWLSKKEIASAVLSFCNPAEYGKPEIWTYYGSYDHVALCQLFGTMMDLPDGFPMYTRDIKQWCWQLGDPELPVQESKAHNALHDAKWTQKAWHFLNELSQAKQEINPAS